jgi:hypothetical protein
LAAFLAPDPIPLTLFVGHPELLDEPLRATATDPDTLADTVGAMVGYSLARRHPDGFEVHRLVQTVIRHRLAPDRQQATVDQALALLAAAAPGNPENPASWPGYARLAPHVLATAPQGDHSPATRHLVLDIAHYLEAIGDSSGSRAVCERVFERWRSRLGPDHPDTLAVMTRLTLVLASSGVTQRGRSLAEDTLQRCRREYGPDDARTLCVAAVLAHLLLQEGQAEPARDLGQDTLQRCRREYGPNHPTTLLAAAAVAVALVQLGKAEAARALGEDTLRRCHQVLGPDHPITLSVASALTTSCMVSGTACS